MFRFVEFFLALIMQDKFSEINFYVNYLYFVQQYGMLECFKKGLCITGLEVAFILEEIRKSKTFLFLVQFWKMAIFLWKANILRILRAMRVARAQRFILWRGLLILCSFWTRTFPRAYIILMVLVIKTFKL